MTPHRLEYAPRYFRRLEDIRERIAVDNPAAATRMIERIRAAVTRLTEAPALGRPGRLAGTRELVIPGAPYIVPYRVKDDVVQIITVLHSAQRWPDRLPWRSASAYARRYSSTRYHDGCACMMG